MANLITMAMAAVLETIVDADFAGDVERAMTFANGYEPTARVLVQRSRHVARDSALAIAIAARSDAYVEPSGEKGFTVGVRSATSSIEYRAACDVVAMMLRAAGFKVRPITTRDGGFHGLRVAYDAKHEATVEAIAPFYAARVRAASTTLEVG